MGSFIKQYSFHLCSRPTFLSEVGRIFDFSGSLNKYNYSRDDTEADAKATYLDWVAVGQDMRNAMMDYEHSK